MREKVSKVLTRISEEEKLLFEYKFFNNVAIDGFDYSSRSYFRRQDKAIKHFGELLGYIGLKEDVFYKKYGDLACVKVAVLHQNGKEIDGSYAREMFG